MGLLQTLRGLVGSNVGTRTEVYVIDAEDYEGLTVFFPDITDNIPEDAIKISLKELGDSLVYFDDSETSHVRNRVKEIDIYDDGEILVQTDLKVEEVLLARN